MGRGIPTDQKISSITAWDQPGLIRTSIPDGRQTGPSFPAGTWDGTMRTLPGSGHGKDARIFPIVSSIRFDPCRRWGIKFRESNYSQLGSPPDLLFRGGVRRVGNLGKNEHDKNPGICRGTSFRVFLGEFVSC